jgi:hypothetical protein
MLFVPGLIGMVLHEVEAAVAPVADAGVAEGTGSTASISIVESGNA